MRINTPKTMAGTSFHNPLDICFLLLLGENVIIGEQLEVDGEMEKKNS